MPATEITKVTVRDLNNGRAVVHVNWIEPGLLCGTALVVDKVESSVCDSCGGAKP